ncbi:MAG: SPASM domain-containing protein [Candidatus Hadarchaeum sp.]
MVPTRADSAGMRTTSVGGKRSSVTHPKCSTCRFQFVCGGGCAVQSLAQTGILEEVVCPPNQDILDRYLEDNAERLLTLFGLN